MLVMMWLAALVGQLKGVKERNDGLSVSIIISNPYTLVANERQGVS